jgi:hypothetical protein
LLNVRATAATDATAGTLLFGVGNTGATLFQNSANSTSALQVLNANGQQVLNIDTSTNPNLITNSNFETGTTGWAIKNGSSIAQDSSNSVIGRNSLAITTGAANRGAQYTFALAASTTYTLSFYAKVSATNGSVLSFGPSDITGTTDNDCVSSTFISQTWARFSCTFAMSSPVSGTRYIYVKQSDATARTLYIDGVQLELASKPTAYTDGGSVDVSGRFSSPINIATRQDTTAALLVSSSTSGEVLRVDNVNNIVYTGQNLVVDSSATNNGTVDLQFGGTGGNNAGIGSKQSATGNQYGLDFYIQSANVFNLNGTGGAATFQNSANSTSALQVKNSAGTTLLNADTTNSRITISGNTEVAGSINTPSGGIGQYGNLISGSADFGDTMSWVNPNVTVATDDVPSNPAPDGSVYADKLTATTANATITNYSYSTTTPGAYVFSVYLKTNGGTQPVQLRIDSVGAVPLTGTTVTSVTATTAWQRFNVTQTFTGTPSSIKPVINIVSNGGVVVAWGAQLNTGTIPLIYTATDRAQYNFGTIGSIVPNSYGANINGNLRLTNDFGGYGQINIGGSSNNFGYLNFQAIGGLGNVANFQDGYNNVFQVGGTGSNSVFRQGVDINGYGGNGLNVYTNTVLKDLTNATNALLVQNATSATILGVSTISATQNLITNGGFEANTAGWALTATAVLTTNTTPQTGTQALNIATSATTLSGATYAYPFKANTTYELSFYARASSATSAVVEYGTKVNAVETACQTGITLTTTYTQFTCTVNVGATVTPGADLIYIRKTGITTPVIFLDSVQLEYGSVATTFADQPTPNLLTNSSVESNTNNWLVRNAGGTPTIASSDDYSLFGARSLKIVTNTSANNGAYYNYNFEPSTQYSVSFWARKDTGSASFTLSHQDVSGTDVGCTTTPDITAVSAVTTTWTQFTCTFKTGATITTPSSISIRQIDAVSDNLYIDGMTLVKGGVAQSFVNPANSLQVDPLYNNLTLNSSNTGELQPWQFGTNTLPNNINSGASFTANGYIYVVGGVDGSATPQTTVYYAKANSDGSTGAWTTSSNPLPTIAGSPSANAANGYVYVTNGTTMYVAKLNTDGSTSAWKYATIPNTGAGSAIIVNGYLYMIAQGTSPTNANTIYAKLNADGSIGAWNSTSALPTFTGSGTVSTANGFIYYIGGVNSSIIAQNSIYYAPTNADGTLGTWVTATSNLLPSARTYHTSFVSNGYVYVIGGNDATGAVQSTVFYAKLYADGTNGAWQTASSYLPALRSSAMTVYNH